MITEIADVERLLASIETNTRVQTELLQQQVVLMERTQKRIDGFCDVICASMKAKEIDGFCDVIHALMKAKEIDKAMGEAHLKVLLIDTSL